MRVYRKIISRLAAAVLFLAAASDLSAQGTAIFYQGQLTVAGTPANANYDFRFAVFTSVTSGSSVSLSLTNYAVPVSNGLFTVALDFGPGIFNGTTNGSNYWLDIGVRAIGVTNFTALAPRQAILPAPYAIFATSASNLLGGLQATQLVGTVPSAQLAGTYSGTVNFSSAANNFAGTFSGNGANLTSLNGSQVTSGTVADARLSGNVALLNGNQTFSGANTFNGPSTFSGSGTYSGVNTFSNNANYFQGSFFGNGLVGWIAVSGTSATAMRDAGYMLQSASVTSLTLPATTALSPGDIVRVSGAGAGGWLVKETTGESIVGNFAAYRNGVLAALPLTTLPGTRNYDGIAASADGSRIYVVGNGLSGSGQTGSIYVSSDGGQNWINIGSNYLSGTYLSVACSANGKIVYAEPTGTTGDIEKSADGGVTWSATTYLASGVGIACSADGSTLFNSYAAMACSGNGTYLARVNGGVVSYSTTGNGASWTTITSPPWSPASATCVGASSDCTRMIVGVNGGCLYATSNQGQSWTQLTTNAQAWASAWMSPDGSKFAAAIANNGVNGGIIYCDVHALPNTASTTSTGSICGSQGSAVELQYTGSSGQFIPVSSSGLLWAN